MVMVKIQPADFFFALADPTRLALVQLLASLPEGHQLCVRALAMRLEVSQPAVAQHLQVLRSVGLVRGERSGARVHYHLEREQLLQGQALLEQIADPAAWQGEALREGGPGASECGEQAASS
jgi:ArsR family transcriptional regulator, arsenate/arsenite/antimonite-responsive transcriptional repressor